MVPTRPLKILHLLSQRPDSTGSGIYVQAMLRESSSRGHGNYLVAGIQSGQPVHPDGTGENRRQFVTFGGAGADVAFTIVGMSDIMPYESTRFRDLDGNDLDRYEAAFAHRLKAAVAAFRPDIIHSHHLWIVTSLTRRLFAGIPLVTTCHGSDLRQFQNCPYLQKRVLDGCRGVDAVMALSRTQKQEIMRLYGFPPQKVVVVGAGYNDRLFVQVPRAAPETVQIVYAGKLSNAKGVPWMLRALSRIDTPDWHLHLVGGGSGGEKADCLRLADGLGRRVTVHGPVSQDRLAEIMKASHLFVLPSLFEGLPLVVLEALASGCRIVATNLPGVGDIIDGRRTDFIDLVATPRLRHVDQPLKADESRFEKNLADALQRQISAARRQPRIDLSAMADRMAEFSWKGVFEKVEAVYSAQLESPRRARRTRRNT